LRLVGVDFGFKRIGIAVAETGFGIATPRAVIEASGSLRIDADRIAELARKEEADAVVIGLPIEEDGNLGKMARVCQSVGRHLSDSGFRVEFIDERYSSLEAESALREESLKASERRKLRDSQSAAILLERFMEEHAAS
jgi:putative Holliday junction resolvase